MREFKKLIDYKANENKISFVGNNLIYHYQMEELCKTHRMSRAGVIPNLEEILDDPKLRAEWKLQVDKRNRTGTITKKLFECWRVNKGCIAFFKASQAKYIYKKFNATHVLDPCAGWGGRALGALNINYTGIDTNLNLKPGYDAMIIDGDMNNVDMIWKSCLDVDFHDIDYDFVLTSPPYENIELYSNMSPFKNDDDFYLNFLIPLLDKCRKNIKRNGLVAFNISPQMYKKLINKYKYNESKFTLDLKEQKNGKSSDLVYFW